MDESSFGQEFASAMGQMLRELESSGYELRRRGVESTVPESGRRFEELVTDEQLRQVSSTLFRDTHYARAVEEAFKCLNNAVKDKAGVPNQEGAGLMRVAFSARSPILRLNPFQSQTDRDEQQGYMDIFAGSMTGIRNPRAHDHELTDTPEVALELLILANHLMRRLDAATRIEQQRPES